MGSIRSAISAYKRIGNFKGKEVRDIIIVSFVIGFILSFRKWGADSFNATMGVQNLIFYFAAAVIGMFAWTFGTKFAAIQFGLEPKYEMWPTGLGISLFICLATNGIPLYISTGGVFMKSHLGLQQGRFYQGPNRHHMSHACFWGLFTLVLVTAVVKYLGFIPESSRTALMLTFLLIGTYTLIPLEAIFTFWQDKVPTSNGTIMFGARITYFMLGVSFMIFAWIFVWYAGLWTLIIGTLLACIVFIFWELFFRPKAVCR